MVGCFKRYGNLSKIIDRFSKGVVEIGALVTWAEFVITFKPTCTFFTFTIAIKKVKVGLSTKNQNIGYNIHSIVN